MGVMKEVAAKKKLEKSGKKKEKPFGAVEVGTVNSEPWKALNKIEAHTYNTLKTFYRGNGEPFKAPFEALKQRSRIKHGGTVDKAVQSLEQKEWIEVTRYAKHGKRRGLRVKANVYKLTFKFDHQRW